MNNFAFIDSQNLNLAIKAQGWTLDFRRFRRYLDDKYKVIRAFLFIGYTKEQEKLYSYLRDAGYILIFKPTVILPGGKIKGNVDAELVLHAMIHFNHYEKAIIVSNDGDFYCLIDHLESNDKLFKLIIPNSHNYSSLLQKFGSYMVYMNALQEKLEYNKERH